MDLPAISIGMTDLMQAARTEVRRVRGESKGDPLAEQKVVLQRLVSAELVTAEEAATLLRVYELGYLAGEGKGNAQDAFFETRRVYSSMAASGKASPVALVVASAAVGSYELSEGPDGSPVITVYKQSYGQALGSIGAGIGALLGGPGGAVLGGAIGGLLGGIVDDKKDKKT